ncbi:TylF/MycF/NovP-related O-methyltransferase [Segetibacter aerophilus]|nr:TylF/MycF/NovP-related O-methyltransferase [Segetibacter aerophilus]
MTLNLLANEIHDKNLDGNVAEVGVFKGEFARLLNQSFPEKILYLFDTFEGFSELDFQTANEPTKYKETAHNFKDTSIDTVLAGMKNKSNCIIKKGYFPETALGLENETFCLVSLDADLYKPIYDGLNFFYPRLTKHGYILVHDYNNKEYPGAKKAVQEFAAENKLSPIPIADGWGSVIFSK